MSKFTPMLKFTPILYVKIENSLKPDPYFIMDSNVEHLVEDAQSEIAEYHLVKKWTVVKAVKMYPVIEKRKVSP